MIFLYIAIGLLVLYLTICIIGASKLFNMFFYRYFTMPQTLIPKSSNNPWHNLPEYIQRDRDWFNTSPTLKTVSITSNDGLKLVGRYLPSENSLKTVILMHGYRCVNSDSDFCYVLGLYRDLCYNILIVDQRSHGKSEGTYLGMGVLERYDCKAWIEFVNKEYAPTDIFLHGLSMGCATVLMTSGLSIPENVRGIVADCGFTSPYDEVMYGLHSIVHVPSFPTAQILNILVKAKAHYGLRDYSTLDAMKINRLPILFFHGGKDKFVPTFMGKANYDACVAQKKLIIVDNAPHASSFLLEPERCKSALVDFLKAYTTV